MNSNIFEVKEKRKGFLVKGVSLLFAGLAFLFITFLPYLFNSFAENRLYFFIIGGIGFVASAILFVLHLSKEIKPSSVIIMTENGFTDKNNTGNLEIEWTNVSTVKLLGKTDSPYLGIILENNDIVAEELKPKFAEIMRDNIEDNLPAILIDQNDVRIPLSELKDIMTQYVRKARAVGNETQSKPKHNPFSTEDVLKAFGKLPDTNENTDKDDNVENTENTKDYTNNTPDIDFNIAAEKETSNDTSETDAALNDSFFEALKSLTNPIAPVENDENDENSIDNTSDDKKENIIPSLDNEIFYTVPAPSETNQNHNTSLAESTEDEKSDEPKAEEKSESEAMSDEINELLSRTKSAKISEIEKILNEKDIPYSYARTYNKDTPQTKEIVENQTSDAPLNENVDNIESVAADSKSFESSLDEMIKTALDEKQNKAKLVKPKSDNEYPDLIILNEEQSTNRNNSDDDNPFIIPDITDYE